jgi:hypothetical protein
MNNTTLRIVSAAGAIAAAGAFTLSAVPAFAAAHTLSITDLTTNNLVGYDTSDTNGDDRGGIALTTNGVFDQGDSDNSLYSLDLTTESTSDLTQENGDAVFTDLSDNASYFFNWTYDEPADSDGTVTIDSFTNVTADGNVGTDETALSENIVFTTYDFAEDSDLQKNYALLNGNGVVGIWDMFTGDLTVIDISTGGVTHVAVNSDQDFIDAGADIHPLFDYEEDDVFGQWGILEFDGTDYSYVGPAYAETEGDPVIARFSLTGDVTDTPDTFAGDLTGEDLWRLVPDCLNDRWYAHIESTNATGAYLDEALIGADASCELGLADTGFNMAPAFGFVAAAISAGGLIVLRRRASR